MVCEPRGTQVMAQDVLARVGLTWHPRRSGRRWLTDSVIGHLLAAHVLEDHEWSVRSIMLDSSGMDSTLRHRPPDRGFSDTDPHAVWAALIHDTSVSWISDA